MDEFRKKSTAELHLIMRKISGELERRAKISGNFSDLSNENVAALGADPVWAFRKKCEIAEMIRQGFGNEEWSVTIWIGARRGKRRVYFDHQGDDPKGSCSTKITYEGSEDYAYGESRVVYDGGSLAPVPPKSVVEYIGSYALLFFPNGLKFGEIENYKQTSQQLHLPASFHDVLEYTKQFE